jgi:hypothetical protein
MFDRSGLYDIVSTEGKYMNRHNYREQITKTSTHFTSCRSEQTDR